MVRCTAACTRNGIRARRGGWTGRHAVTGGLGGLGLRAAVLLAQGGALQVALVSRSGGAVRGEPCLEMQLRSLGVAAEVAACDSAVLMDSSTLLGWGVRLSGVLHAASRLRTDHLQCRHHHPNPAYVA